MNNIKKNFDDKLIKIQSLRKKIIERWDRVSNFDLNENDFNGNWIKINTNNFTYE